MSNGNVEGATNFGPGSAPPSANKAPGGMIPFTDMPHDPIGSKVGADMDMSAVAPAQNARYPQHLAVTMTEEEATLS